MSASLVARVDESREGGMAFGDNIHCFIPKGLDGRIHTGKAVYGDVIESRIESVIITPTPSRCELPLGV